MGQLKHCKTYIIGIPKEKGKLTKFLYQVISILKVGKEEIVETPKKKKKTDPIEK